MLSTTNHSYNRDASFILVRQSTLVYAKGYFGGDSLSIQINVLDARNITVLSKRSPILKRETIDALIQRYPGKGELTAWLRKQARIGAENEGLLG